MYEVQQGYRVGDDHGPDAYQLLCRIRAGGEGEVWRASSIRQDGLTDHYWAVKILHPHHLLGTDDNETMGSALNRWHARLRSSLDENAQVRHEVPGIVGPARVFVGDRPHPPGEPGPGRTLYVVSPWVEGRDLGEWRRIRAPSFGEICAILAKLAAIVDGIANRAQPLIHRDISPGNVIIGAEGQVSLIDSTFIRPSNSAAGTVLVVNGGFTAPEVRSGHCDPAADRYSFGAVAHYLLSRAEPATENAAADCRAVLIRYGLSAAIADHVADLLHADSSQRPRSLAEWTERLTELGHRDVGPGRYLALALAIDGTSTPVIAAANVTGVSEARLGVGRIWYLSHDRHSPPDVTALAAVTDGSGGPVIFAIADRGTVFANRAGGWTELGPAVSGAGIAAIRDPRGVATAFVVDPAEHNMAIITVGLDGVPRRVNTDRPVRRVLSAATDQDGTAAIFVLSAGGDLACITTEGADQVSDRAFDAAGCVDRWGELCCYQIVAGQSRLTCFDRSMGDWAATLTAEVPLIPTTVRCVGHRQGVTIALGGTAGLYLALHNDDGFGAWHALTRKPCHQVALGTGAAGRLKLAALVEGRVVLAAEDFDGGWSMGLTTL